MKNQLFTQIIENYIQAYNQFDVEKMMADMHDNLKFENISDGVVTLAVEGIHALKNQAKQAVAIFKERKQTITNYKFNDHEVTVDIDFEGTLATDLPGGLKAGNRLDLKGKSIFNFVGNKIIYLGDIR